MGPGRPANLTHSTAYLTDKPYDVQLGVLKWIRGLLSEVIDEAASQLSTTAASIEPDQGTCGVNSTGGVQEENDLVLPDAEKRKENGQELGGEENARVKHGSSGEGVESTHKVSKSEQSNSTEEESRAVVRTTAAAAAAAAAAAEEGVTTTAAAEVLGGGSASVGRKRPRTPTQPGQEIFGLGDVVECFHADDGLWYPATITAVIAPPPPLDRADQSETPSKNSPEQQPLTEGARIENEESPSQLLEEKKHSSSSTLGPPSMPASEPTLVGADSVEGENKAESSIPADSMPAEAQEGGSCNSVVVADPSKAMADVEEKEEAQQQRHQEQLLEVTFLGYGNQARVPRDWVRQIVTPEVLEWCKDNGITAASAGAHVEEACASSSPAIDAATTAEAERDGVDGDALSDARAPAATVTTRAEELDAASRKAAATASAPVSENEGKNPVAEKGSDAVVAGTDGSVDAEGKQRNQRQPRKRKKNANKNNKSKNNKNNRNNNSNKNNNNNNNNRRGAAAAGTRQVGTPEEEEERFLMRCASRSRSPYPHVPNKYWGQRYRYFSRFDEGVTMDEEGWYSVTPEAIARHIAERVCCDVVVDPFVGCGGNAVQFALVAHVVFAIDLDPVKLEHARRNAAIYGVENRIEFILGDAMKVLPTLKADAVFLSPPWGGPAYSDSKTFDLNTMIPPPLSALEMFRAARQVTPNVVFFLPRNVDAFQVAGLPAAVAASTAVVSESENAEEEDEEGAGGGAGGVTELSFDDTCELEKHFLNGKLKTTAAYFGEDIAVTREREEAEKDATKEVGSTGVVVVPALHDADAASPDTSVGWYGGDDKGKAATWTGRHVRFSEDGEEGQGSLGGGGGGGGGGCGAAGGVGASGDSSVGEVSISRKRENDLYEAWVAT